MSEATPKEFKFREYEWKWLCPHFHYPDFMASSTTNMINRAGLTEQHSLGSRSLARVSHEATSSDIVDNPFVYVSQKVYLNRVDEHERVRDESHRILAQIARDQYSDLAVTDLNFAIGHIDQVDPYICARVWDTVYPPKNSRFRTPMMGAEGHKLLKDTPGFQRSRRGYAQRVFLEEQLRAERELRAESERKTQVQLEQFQRQQEVMMQYVGKILYRF